MSINGSDPHVILTPSHHQPLSSAQRDEQRRVMAELLKLHNGALLELRNVAESQGETIRGLLGRVDDLERHIVRLDALERVSAARWALPLMARLRWLVRGA